MTPASSDDLCPTYCTLTPTPTRAERAYTGVVTQAACLRLRRARHTRAASKPRPYHPARLAHLSPTQSRSLSVSPWQHRSPSPDLARRAFRRVSRGRAKWLICCAHPRRARCIRVWPRASVAIICHWIKDAKRVLACDIPLTADAALVAVERRGNIATQRSLPV
eukprot:311633-Chlamydomonas_euryale.AAC.11